MDFSDGVCRALYRQERRSVWFVREHAHMYTVGGDLLLHKVGGPRGVAMTRQDVEAARGAVWTHNHPRISALSIDDLERAFEGQVAELRAVDPSWVYRLRDPDGWAGAKWRTVLATIGYEIRRLKTEGLTDIQECNHLGMAAAAAAVQMVYSRTSWHPPFAGALQAKAWITARILSHRRSAAAAQN